MKRVLLGTAVLLVACETRAPSADSLAAAATDTADPVVVTATDSARRADSIRAADTIAAVPATTATKTTTSRPPAATSQKAPPTTQKTATPPADSHIGRDSVIRRPGRMPIRPDTLPEVR